MRVKINPQVLSMADRNQNSGKGLTLSDGYQLWQRISAAGTGGSLPSEGKSSLPTQLPVAGRLTPVGNPLND